MNITCKLIAVFLLILFAIPVFCAKELPYDEHFMTQEEAFTEETSKDSHGGQGMQRYDLTQFKNVTVTGISLNELSDEQMSVLYALAEYCQAMTDADTVLMKEHISEDMVFIHMSGRKQTKEEYLADIAEGVLRYYTIGIENPVITVNADNAEVMYTSVLNANAYGARGTYRITGTHRYELRDGEWLAVSS